MSEEQRAQVIDRMLDQYIRKHMADVEISDEMRDSLRALTAVAVDDMIADV